MLLKSIAFNGGLWLPYHLLLLDPTVDDSLFLLFVSY